ncbi:MAG: hypothetical protein KAI66_15590, partial [Lentisphaeria bacterium]|nr:hypothetical protein [Lentisphaeria bacterium]
MHPTRLQSITICLVALAFWFSATCVQAQTLPPCGREDGRFTLRTITPDGDISDWTSGLTSAGNSGGVLGDLDNNSRDGATAGGTVYQPQPDRDAPVKSTGRDLMHFAWTWDSTDLAAYTRRAASANNVQRFIYYADTDNDGYMENGEPVVVAGWQGNTGLVEIYLGTYNAINNTIGDSMVDSNGYGDGYTLPGTILGLPSPGHPDYSGNWGVTSGADDGLVMEWKLPWTIFGVTAGSAFTFHVSSMNSQPGAASFVSQVDDNLAGCGGGAASTQYAALLYIDDESDTAIPGETIWIAHTVKNNGNGTDIYDLTYTDSGDFSPIVTFYKDVNQNGVYDAGTDTPLIDNDGTGDSGYGTVDTGPVSSGGTSYILIKYEVPIFAQGWDTATIISVATSTDDDLITDTVTDTITVVYPDLILLKSVDIVSAPGLTNPKAIPGAIMEYTITATNVGNGTVDSNTTVVVDKVPDDMEMFVGDLGAIGSGPVTFSDGTTTSDLNYLYTRSGDLSFSDDVAP